MFEFLFVIGIVLAFYGYSVMKNPHVWGDQGRDEIRPENWNGYVAHNGQFMMYSGFFLAALAALDVIFTFASWLYCLILLGGLALAGASALETPALAAVASDFAGTAVDNGVTYRRTNFAKIDKKWRRQVVKSDATSHRIQVITDGGVLFDFPCSYGEADKPRNVTRSGTHVVTEKYADFWMSNPAAGYSNVHERWAVRISNNGEFIHANPASSGAQGNTNVTNGCINLSTDNAQQYFQTAIYGDPVEVTGTSIQLSYADGDIWDWAVDWATWVSMSALPPAYHGSITQSWPKATVRPAAISSGTRVMPRRLG